ncbi:MAG: SprB repeat-containing protein [Bacteroidetes bacterium]|nr:SprB repeat-containing protein [Bacteroidota bacterium]
MDALRHYPSHHPTKCFGIDNCTVTNVNCNGNSNGAININVAGGTTPYTYSWSNGATTQNVTNLSPNTYTVTVTDANGCTATLSQAITQPNALALTIGTVTNVNCNGNNNGAININIAGGTTPYAYSWSNGATTQNVITFRQILIP